MIRIRFTGGRYNSLSTGLVTTGDVVEVTDDQAEYLVARSNFELAETSNSTNDTDDGASVNDEYHGVEYRELQALAQDAGIPANQSADALRAALREHEPPDED